MEFFYTYFWQPDFDLWQVLIRAAAAVLIGGLVGLERARHGRAAGMRTHMLVCLGAAITAMTGMYLHDVLGLTGDVARLSAQVVSGLGFLGAGVIILKHGNTITGLTTAAGMWATGSIGIAIGYGFYVGALIAVLLLFASLGIFSKLERNKRDVGSVYLELDDMSCVNEVVDRLATTISVPFSVSVTAPRSGMTGHIGINLILRESNLFDITPIRGIDHVLFAVVDEF